ncbi:MAG: type I-D CRISPR-associated protein Cas7/Csc2 [Nitrososphaerota archaeon]
MSVDNVDKIVEDIKGRLSTTIPVLRTPKTVQIMLIRQTHDYTILRTEETRELNVAVTPTSISNPAQRARVVFLASKQKAPETREFAAMIKEYYRFYNLKSEAEKAILECEIKDKLCRACPRCTLFGAVETDQKSPIWKKRWNIKHRIEYSSAFSIEPYDLISENITFNAVTESTQLTEQALGLTENVAPMVNFPSIVSLNSPTWAELVLVIKNILRCKSYGAEGRTKGDTVNYITGLIFANEEVLTPLEYVLELSEPNVDRDFIQATYNIAQKYGRMATFQEALRILSPQELENFVDYVQTLQPGKDLITKAFNDSLEFGKEIEKLAKD